MNIYNEQGYLKVDEIAAAPEWLKVIIGARQVGKTYSVLKYHIDNNIPFILLRRTTEELNLIGDSPELNPFKVYEPEYKIGIFKSRKYYTINHYSVDEDGKTIKGEAVGMALSLSQIAHIRGFNGGSYRSIVFDEFIPEKAVRVLKTEGDALLNAYTTINSNRELNDQPPCQLWLLANSNNINSYILAALNLTADVIKARRKKIEVFKSGEALIIQPQSFSVLEKRRDTALMRQVRKDDEFYGMAINNDWSYDDSPLIQQLSIKHMTPLFSYGKEIYAWESDRFIYFCKAPHNVSPYGRGSWDLEQLRADYLWLTRYYAEGLVLFSDLYTLNQFRQIFTITF